MRQLIERFVEHVRRGDVEIYNEFSLQLELGLFLRSHLRAEKVQFERNTAFFFPDGDFIKREIDISIFAPDRSRLQCAIELKFPRNGQYPEQMFSFCKDMRFAEQLRGAGFEKTYVIIFADDPLFYSGSGQGIYGYFRQAKVLQGTVKKPTGERDEQVELDGKYEVRWLQIIGPLSYTVIEGQ